MFAWRVRIVSHSSCRTSAILKYFCPLGWEWEISKYFTYLYALLSRGLDCRKNTSISTVHQLVLLTKITTAGRTCKDPPLGQKIFFFVLRRVAYYPRVWGNRLLALKQKKYFSYNVYIKAYTVGTQRTISLRWFFWAPKSYVKTDG